MATAIEPSEIANATDHSVTNDSGPASFFCRQCQSVYRQPKILKCLHSFCTQCIEQDFPRTPDKTSIVCPLCTCVTDLSQGGIEELTSNSFLERISKDYVKEVKSNLASRSLKMGEEEQKEQQSHDNSIVPHSPTPPSPRLSTAFHHDLKQHDLSNMTDEQKSQSSRTQEALRHRNIENSKESHATAVEAIQNTKRLQAKMMGLQGEALRVTYAIDRVNHQKTEWLQRREDLKRAIQRRSAQFQMLVKKMERQLISQVDEKTVEDRFYESLERGKTELRKNLKQVLHEVSVMKGVRETGGYAEINELSSVLLSPSVGIGEVAVNRITYQLDFPTKHIDEMVRVGFGNLVMTTEENSVYLPELKDYATIKLDEISTEEEASHSIALNNYSIMSAISGDPGAKPAGCKRSASTVGRLTRRRSSDFGKTDIIIEEFQNARESLRNRRQEILRQGQSSRESSPWRAEPRRASRPTTRQTRGQSLDRGTKVTESNRKLLSMQSLDEKAGKENAVTIKKEERVLSKESSRNVSKVSASSTYRPDENITMPSPIKEETTPPIMSKKSDVPKLNLTDVSVSLGRTDEQLVPLSPFDQDKTSFQDLMPVNRSRVSSSSSTSSTKPSPSMSPTYSPEFHGRNVESPRHIRRAINSAADMKSKIEFLRENWQKRKEILIQNRGFVSSEENTSAKMDSQTAVANISDGSSSTQTASAKPENGHHTQIPLASRGIGSPPLRSKFTSVRQSQQKPEQPKATQRLESTNSDINKNTNITITTTIFDDEINRTTEGSIARVTLPTFRGTTVGNHERNNGIDSGSKPEELEDSEDEEVEVVETETITIPITNEIAKGIMLRNETQYVEKANTAPVETTVEKEELISESKETGVEDEEETVVIDDAVDVTIPVAAEAYSKSTKQRTPMTKTDTTSSNSSKTGALQRRTLATDWISRSTESTTSTVSTDTSSVLATSPGGSQTSKEITSTTTSDSMTSLTPGEMESFSEKTEAKYISLPSLPASSHIKTESTASVTVITAASTLSSTTTTTRSSLSSSSTSVSQSTTSAYTSRSRYTPRTETVDIAALLANFYKPPPQLSSSTQDKNRIEDNKENVGSRGTTTSITQKQNVIERSKSTDLYSPASMNKTFHFDTYSDNKQHLDDIKTDASQKSSTDQGAVSSAFRRNIYASTLTQESRTSSAKETPLQDVHNSQTSITTTKSTTSTTNAVETMQTNKDTNGTRSTTPQSSNPSRNTVSSIYSKYYSNTNSYYSKPSDTMSKSIEEKHQSPHDLKVAETFTQAESSRTRYDPSESATPQSRRHTVEIGKTLPTGVKILDLYKGHDTTIESNPRLRRSEKTGSTSTIEESTTEAESDWNSVFLSKEELQQPLPSSVNLEEARGSRNRIPLHKEPIVAVKVESRVAKSRTMPSLPMASVSDQTILHSPTTHLSTASSPASSPLTEDKKFITSSPGTDTSESKVNSGPRNMKEIARKKRERWRRLTVY